MTQIKLLNWFTERPLHLQQIFIVTFNKCSQIQVSFYLHQNLGF